MNYSIRKKMFFISMATTMFSFILIILSFNVLIRNHIERESTSQLNRAVKAMKAVSVTPFISEDGDGEGEGIHFGIEISQLPMAEIDEQKAHEIKISTTTSIVDYIDLNIGAIEEASGDLEYFLLDSSDGSVVYPVAATSYALRGENEVKYAEERKEEKGKYFRDKEINALHNFVEKNKINTPQRVNLNNTNYYIMETDIAGLTSAVFYKNIQPLEDLATNVNFILVGILIFSGIISIAAYMGLSNGMVQSIQKLCCFANDIGAGQLKEQKLCLNEKELMVLENDMNEMAKKLRIHDEQQKTFFQNVSHELKTPLMSIQGYAEGITSHVFENEKAEEAAEIILTESDRLTDMINNMLYLSRMDSKDRVEKKEIFEVTEALQGVMEQAQNITTDKKIIYEQVGEEVNVYGNREAFQKAVTNILTNGIRYANTKVVILCDCERNKIEIADDGNGIAQKDMPHIFKRFYKGEGGCSGVGLAIAQAAIEGMQGKLWAENRDGAVFTICLHPTERG